LGHFGRQEGFWDRLTARAEILGLTGPLSHCARYLARILAVPLPDPLQEAVRRWQPGPIRQAFFDALFERALLPNHGSCDDHLTSTARWLLYVRAHYLRMPFPLLLPHLARKSVTRAAAAPEKNSRRTRQTQIEAFLRGAPRRARQTGGDATAWERD
jgi:hypothetical protein